jgi:hypothetical protein
MKTRILLLVALCVGLVAQQSKAQSSKQKFNLRLKGKIVDETALKNYDHILVGVLWHQDDLNPTDHSKERQWNMSANLSKVKKNGKYSLKITQAPRKQSCIATDQFQLSIGFVMAFADNNKNGKFDRGDKILGLTEGYALTYVNGNYIEGLNALEKKIGKKIKTLRKLKNGVYINKAIAPKVHGLDVPFDDLYPAKNQKMKLDIRIPKNLRDLDVPNWT